MAVPDTLTIRFESLYVGGAGIQISRFERVHKQARRSVQVVTGVFKKVEKLFTGDEAESPRSCGSGL